MVEMLPTATVSLGSHRQGIFRVTRKTQVTKGRASVTHVNLTMTNLEAASTGETTVHSPPPHEHLAVPAVIPSVLLERILGSASIDLYVLQYKDVTPISPLCLITNEKNWLFSAFHVLK